MFTFLKNPLLYNITNELQYAITRVVNHSQREVYTHETHAHHRQRQHERTNHERKSHNVEHARYLSRVSHEPGAFRRTFACHS